MLPKLSLYKSDSCIYCVFVLRAIKDLGLDVQLRDVRRDPEAYQQLMEAQGRGTVPVLRIESEEGVRWMPESRAIVQYLQTLMNTPSF